MRIHIFIDTGQRLKDLLEERSLHELRCLAKRLCLTGYSRLTKESLIALLLHQPPEFHRQLRMQLSDELGDFLRRNADLVWSQIYCGWRIYGTHVYGISGIVGMVLTLLGLLMLLL